MENQEAGGRAARYGVVKPLWFWSLSVFAGPFLLMVSSVISGVVLGLVGFAPLVLLGSDDRLAGTIWHVSNGQADEVFGICFGIGFAVTATMILARWATRALTHIRLDERGLVCWSLSGRTSIAWDKVVRAFITQNPGPEENPTLHLWTKWREVALPMDRVVDEMAADLQRGAFDVFLGEVRERLAEQGMAMEDEVPTSLITDASWPLRYKAFWPHRRVLAHRLARLRGGEPPRDQRKPMAPMHLAWVFRPAPVMAAVTAVCALVLVRWWTESEAAPSVLAGAGLLLGLAIPVWNLLKEKFQAGQNRGALTPEQLVGHCEAPEPLPKLLLPARGCHVDLDKGRIGRPDGRVFNIDDIGLVDYGPPRRAGAVSGSIQQQAWHLALGLKGKKDKLKEIFHNASVDIVRHGDVDAGYAVFNWITARAIAQLAGADLVLAQGRVPGSMVGRTLVEMLGRDVVEYDPDEVGAGLDKDRAGVKIRADERVFEAWGPLVRMPEGCASPPLIKGALALGLIALIPTGFTAAGLLAGWLLVGVLHDVLTMRHFTQPGFALDDEGVWVRGQHIAWESLEQSTLMPVAPGPILFAGKRSVLVVGHLGGTYLERAWLGCAAYQWIQRRHPEYRA